MAVIAWRNAAEAAGVSLSASSEVPGLGVGALLERTIGNIWRSAAVGAAEHRFLLDLGTEVALRLLAIGAPRDGALPGAAATIRWRAGELTSVQEAVATLAYAFATSTLPVTVAVSRPHTPAGARATCFNGAAWEEVAQHVERVAFNADGSRNGRMSEEARTNLHTDPRVGFTAPGGQTIATSTEVAPVFSTATVKKHTYSGGADTNWGASGIAVSAAAGLRLSASVWIWVPSSFTGTAITVMVEGGNWSGNANNTADLSKRNQWQRISTSPVAASGGGTNTTMLVRVTGGTTTGNFFYTCSPQAEIGDYPTSNIFPAPGATGTSTRGAETYSTTPLVVTRAQPGNADTTLRRADGGWEEVPANVPRLHAAALDGLLAWLRERGRTNSITNPRGVGAAPGVAPTGWTATPGVGLTATILGAVSRAGMTGMRVQLSGTTNAAGVALSCNLASVAFNSPAGGKMALSVFHALASGSAVGMTSALRLTAMDAAIITTAPVTSEVTRAEAIFTNTAAAASGAASYRLQVASAGLVVDLVLDLMWPQLEPDVPTTPILPPPGVVAASTRGAESVTFPALAGMAAGTLYTEQTIAGAVRRDVVAWRAGRTARWRDGTLVAETLDGTPPTLEATLGDPGAGALIRAVRAYGVLTDGQAAALSASGSPLTAPVFDSGVLPLDLRRGTSAALLPATATARYVSLVITGAPGDRQLDLGRLWVGDALVPERAAAYGWTRSPGDAGSAERAPVSGQLDGLRGATFRGLDFDLPLLTEAEALLLEEAGLAIGSYGQAFVSPLSRDLRHGMFGRFAPPPAPAQPYHRLYRAHVTFQEDL